MRRGVEGKSRLWKFASWLMGFAVFALVFLIWLGMSTGISIALASIYAALAVALSAPYALRPREYTGGGGGWHFELPWFLFFMVVFYTVLFKFFIWVGDIILTILWSLVGRGRSIAS